MSTLAQILTVISNLVVIVGVVIALKEYKITLFSQKVANATQLIKTFYDSLGKKRCSRV